MKIQSNTNISIMVGIVVHLVVIDELFLSGISMLVETATISPSLVPSHSYPWQRTSGGLI